MELVVVFLGAKKEKLGMEDFYAQFSCVIFFFRFFLDANSDDMEGKEFHVQE